MTIPEFCASLANASEAGEYIVAYMGGDRAVREFADEFVRRKDFEASSHTLASHRRGSARLSRAS